MNKRQAAAGQRLFVNPRNSAAGALRQKDPARHGHPAALFWAYQVGVVEGAPGEEQVAGGHAVGHAGAARPRPGFPVSPDARQVTGIDAVDRPLRGAGRRSATTWPTRSTAW